MRTIIRLPFFCGFYNTLFDISELEWQSAYEEYNEYVSVLGQSVCDKLGLSKDDFEASDEYIESYQRGVCDAFIDVVKERCPEWVKDIEFIDMWSPSAYNFATDECRVSLDLSDDWFEQAQKWMIDNEEELRKRIRKDWSSRDGFFSFVSNDYDEWFNMLVEETNLYLEILLSYYIKLECGDNVREEIEYEVWEMSPYFYVRCTKPYAVELYTNLKE